MKVKVLYILDYKGDVGMTTTFHQLKWGPYSKKDIRCR